MLPCDIIITAVMTMIFGTTIPIAIAHCARKTKLPQQPLLTASGTPRRGTSETKSANKVTVTSGQLKKLITSGMPSPIDGRTDKKHLEQHKKSTKNKPKSQRDKGNSKQSNAQIPGQVQSSKPPCLGVLDKTQEDSYKSKSSKHSGGDKHYSDGKDETNDADKREEDEKIEPLSIVSETHVQQLGNLDEIIKDARFKLNKEIEEMSSIHEHDKRKEDPFDSKRHVIINEKKCKMYTTNNEVTKSENDRV